MKDIKLGIRQNLETKRYILYFVFDCDEFDIWAFKNLHILRRVKNLIEEDMEEENEQKNI